MRLTGLSFIHVSTIHSAGVVLLAALVLCPRMACRIPLGRHRNNALRLLTVATLLGRRMRLSRIPSLRYSQFPALPCSDSSDLMGGSKRGSR